MIQPLRWPFCSSLEWIFFLVLFFSFNYFSFQKGYLDSRNFDLGVLRRKIFKDNWFKEFSIPHETKASRHNNHYGDIAGGKAISLFCMKLCENCRLKGFKSRIKKNSLIKKTLEECGKYCDINIILWEKIECKSFIINQSNWYWWKQAIFNCPLTISYIKNRWQKR